VKAGLVPRVVADGWLALPVVRPGTAPIAALAQAVASSLGSAVTETPDGVAEGLRALVSGHPGRKVLLVVDQLEELVTLVRTAAERDTTLALFARLAVEHADVLRLVLTLRTDFEPNFDRAVFGDRWRAGRFVVQPMSREDLRAVIEQPAAKRVVYFEPSALVETLLDEVVATPGALPLLSFALSEMYLHYLGRRSDDRAITRDDYDALGGVVGALRARAEAEHDALDEAHRATLRRLMLRMVVAEGGTVARRRVADAELDFPDAAENARAGAVLHRLTSARLLVEGKDPDGDAFVEPAHDALVRGWGRLLQWVREESEAAFPLAQRQRLSRAAADWERADRRSQSGLLWSDAVRSAQLAPLVRRRDPLLNRRELEFARRSVRGRRVLLGVAAAAVLVVAAAGVWALVSGRRATERAEQMRIGAIVRTAASLASDDPLTARLLLASLDTGMLGKADAATHLALLGTANGLYMRPSVSATFGELGSGLGPLRLSPDGSRVVAVTMDDAIRAWRLDGGTDATTGVDSAPPDPTEWTEATVDHDRQLTFDETGARFATVGSTGTIHVWQAGRGAPLGSISAPPGRRIARLSFTPDGDRVVVFRGHTRDGQDVPAAQDSLEAELWSVTGERFPTHLALAKGERPVAEDGGGGTFLLTVTRDSALRLWDPGGPAAPLRTVRVRGTVANAIVSPDADHVAVIGGDHVVHVLPLTGGGRPVRLTGHTGAVTAATWSRDGRRLVTVGDDGARVWDIAEGRNLARLQRDGETLAGAEFDLTGDAVVTRSSFGYEAIVWRWPDDPAGPANGFPTVLAGHADRLTEARFLDDDGRVFTASVDGTARVWEANAWLRSLSVDMFDAHEIVDERSQIRSAAFSPDGRMVAVATAGGIVGVDWLDRSQPPKLLARDLDTQVALAFTPDGRRLTALSVSGRQRVWELDALDAGRVVRDEKLLVVDADVFAGGRFAISHGEVGADTAGSGLRNDVAGYLWDLTGAAPARRLVADGEPVGCPAVSEDGRWLATCTQLGTVRLQRVGAADGEPPALELPVPGLGTAASLARDGSLLAVGTFGGVLQLITPGPRPATRELRGSFSSIEGLQFSPDGRRLLSYSRDGMVRVWDVASGRPTLAIRPRGMEVASARFTPDGRRVLALPAVDTVAYLWNADGSGGVAGFSGVGRILRHVFVSPDGKWLLTTLDDGSAGLWPLDAAQLLRDMDGAGVCLPVADRIRYLSERERDAADRHAACEAEKRPRDTKSP
jgi:WD40 repeat protein